METLKIDPEFRDLLQKLSQQEFEQLEQNILKDGLLHEIMTWNGIIIDGHNRYEICRKHDIPFQTLSKQFADRQEVMDWIDKNQLGRRNLTPDQMSLIRGRMYNRAKGPRGGQCRIDGQKPSSQNVNWAIDTRTCAVLGHDLGVSSKTILQDGKLASAIEVLPEVAEKIRNGEKVVKSHVIAAAKAKKEGNEEVAKAILEGKHGDLVIPPMPEGDIKAKIDHIFEQAKIFEKWDRTILDLQKEVLEHSDANPAMAFVYVPYVKQYIKNLRSELNGAKPHAVCPSCSGEGNKCGKCQNTGFITEQKGS